MNNIKDNTKDNTNDNIMNNIKESIKNKVQGSIKNNIKNATMPVKIIPKRAANKRNFTIRGCSHITSSRTWGGWG